jgi:hypothetical protein
MNYNPYAAPQAAPPPAAAPQAGSPQPWEIGEVFAQAWNVFRIHWVTLAFAFFLMSLCGSGPSYVWAAVDAARGATGVEALGSRTGGSQIINLAITSFFQVGLIRMFLSALRGNTPNFADLFSGGPKFLPMFGLQLLMGLACGLGLVFLLVPGIILYCGLFISSYYLVDADLGVSDALKASWDATSGQRLPIFFLSLCQFGLNLAGLCACCVGVFATAPLTMLVTAIVFLRISGRGGAAPLPPFAQGQGYPPAGYGPPGGAPPGGYGGPPPGGAPPGGGGYGPPPGGGGGGYGPPPGAGGGGYGPPGGGGGYGGGGPPPGGGGGWPR